MKLKNSKHPEYQYLDLAKDIMEMANGKSAIQLE